MTPSTANVAMPAARPERRISGIPTTSANTPPRTVAKASDATLPTECSPRNENSPGVIVGFNATGTVITPAVKAPTATKLT